MATQENLKDAFARESRANQKYLVFAERAKQEGDPQVVHLFRAAAAEATQAQARCFASFSMTDTACPT